MYYIYRGALLIFAITLLCSCAGKYDIIRARENNSEGVSVIYEVNAKSSFAIAMKILQDEKCDISDSSTEKGLIFASTGVTGTSLGTVIGVWIEPVDEERSRVTVIIKRKVATNILAIILTENKFHKKFQTAVDAL